MFHRKSPFVASLAAAALLGLSSMAQAAPATWTIDPNHSNVSFTIRHFFSKVTGSFQKFSGKIVYDPANASGSSVTADIDAASIYTANDKRDGHLRSPDFFDVEKFPKLTFQSTKVTTQGDKLLIEGNLTMHGITKPVTLEGAVLGANADRAGFEASGKVDRKDFGIIWNRVVDQGTMLGDDVTISIAVEANSEAAEAKRAEMMKKAGAQQPAGKAEAAK